MTDYTKQGWVRLHRQIENNFLWFLEPFTKAQAWIDLFLNANHKDGIINIRGNIIPIKRGQIGWSELTMAKRWTWSKNKVRRYLKLLEKEQQIKQQKSAITTIITIVKYETYQNNDTADDTTERQQKDSRRYTNNNDKNDKNDKKYIADKSAEVFNSDDYIQKMINNPNKHISLIGRYFKERNNAFPSQKAAGAEIKRWLRSASELAEYPEKQINQSFNYVIKEFPKEWNLSTVAKYINNQNIWN